MNTKGHCFPKSIILHVKGEPHHNIFSNKPQPLNQYYLKTF